MCLVDRRIYVAPEPRWAKDLKLFDFEIHQDSDESFGNPRFVVTDPPECRW